MHMSDYERDPSFITFDLPSDRTAAREVRRRVLDFARHLPFSKGDLNSIEIAVGEAAVNTVRHGSPFGGVDHLHVRCEVHDGTLTIEISDKGQGFAPASVPCPVAEDLKSHGYGLCLMNGLMDDVAFDFTAEGGTTVRMTKHLPHPAN